MLSPLGVAKHATGRYSSSPDAGRAAEAGLEVVAVMDPGLAADARVAAEADLELAEAGRELEAEPGREPEIDAG